ALTDGAVRIGDFEADAVMDERVRRLLPLITTRPHPDMPDDSPKQFGAEVIVALADGRRVARRIDPPGCRGGDNPTAAGELFEKFADCAGRALAHDQIAPLFARLESLETAADLGEVTRLLMPHTAVLRTTASAAE